MPDMRRRGPGPPPGLSGIQFKPGIAKETLRELAPLLAEEGIDAGNIDVPDLDTLQRAMDRAVERHAGHWTGERAATDILALARKGRAFRSLNALITGKAASTSSTAAPSPPPFTLGHADLARSTIR